MAMSATGMKTSIIARLEAAGVVQPDNADTVWEAVAQGIIDHLVASGGVTVVITPATVSLQTSTAAGAPTAGPPAPVTLIGTLS